MSRTTGSHDACLQIRMSQRCALVSRCDTMLREHKIVRGFGSGSTRMSTPSLPRTLMLCKICSHARSAWLVPRWRGEFTSLSRNVVLDSVLRKAFSQIVYAQPIAATRRTSSVEFDDFDSRVFEWTDLHRTRFDAVRFLPFYLRGVLFVVHFTKRTSV